jgi:acetylornithine deacetylase/succinyl-diaminopimelate desuccinylase-like protein
MRLASGAGHDAVVVAEARHTDGSHIPVGMLFVPCRGGISHSREEYASPEQLARGAEVLRDAMLELVTQREPPAEVSRPPGPSRSRSNFAAVTQR